MHNKRILCHSFIFRKKCNYEDKCLYAHSLAEQNIDKYRSFAYKIITSQNEIYSNINLFENQNLYKVFLLLTKLCEACEQNLCHGGYNCRFGACKKEYRVCIADLIDGSCIYGEKCNRVHLSKKGIFPYEIAKLSYKQKKKKENEKKILSRFIEKYLVLTDNTCETLDDSDVDYKIDILQDSD